MQFITVTCAATQVIYRGQGSNIYAMLIGCLLVGCYLLNAASSPSSRRLWFNYATTIITKETKLNQGKQTPVNMIVIGIS